MSNYPPTQPYSPGYGARDNANTLYLPPTYPNQFQQNTDGRTAQAQVQANLASDYGAYGYNRAIPTFSTTAVASGVPPLPIYQGWNQDSVPLPPYTTPSNTSQYTGYSNSSQHDAQYYPVASQTTYQPNIQAPKPFDQSELSEGEFEDGAITINTPPAGYRSAPYQGSDATGYMDNVQRAVYSRVQDYSPQQSSYPANNFKYSAQEVSQSSRQDSASYSPYVSPREDNGDQSRTNQYQDTYAPNHSNVLINGVAQPQYGWSQNGQGNSLQPSINANGHKALKAAEDTNQVQPAQVALSKASYPLNNKNLAAEKKKAQGAILNLWPYDVRYQTYIHEGFKEDIVGRLFDDLRMPRTLPKAVHGAQPIQDVQSFLGTSARASLVQGNITPTIYNGNLGHQTKIDVKNDVSANHNPATLGLNAKQPLINDSTPETPATLNDKERTIQAKMEALRKSREERAQKAAAQKSAKPSASTAPVPVTQQEGSKSTEASKGSSSASESPTSAAQLAIPNQLAPPHSPAPSINPQQRPPTIPGLFLASNASSPAPPATTSSSMYAPLQTNPRKRPVAADFDEPFTSMIPIKRPFGHSRTDHPLVIDVSEDEVDSDDEDVAMDLESEANQDSPTQSTRSIDTRSAAIQNLPALSNFPSRKPTSPASSAANTPPIPQIASRSSLGKPEVLQRKESEIELLKKKIAEAEARKKARQTPTGTRTPKSAEISSVEGNSNVAVANVTSNVEASIAMVRLIRIADNQVCADQQRLEEAEAAELVKVEDLKRNEAERVRLRRQEIETELPLVESEYQENQRKLEEMRAEMARIEATVQKNLEQKQRFNEEMARLGQETENQLQAQKEKLRDLTKDEVGGNAATSLQSLSKPGEETDYSPESITNGQLPMRSVLAQPSSSSKSADEQASSVDQAPTPTQIGLPVLSNGTSKDVPQFARPDAVGDSAKESASADHALEAVLQEAVRVDADSQAPRDGDSDRETLYAPNPKQAAPDSSAIEEKGSSAYSPLFRRASVIEDRESDDYEPPEATPPSASPPFSLASLNDNYLSADEPMQDVVLSSAIEPISDNTSRQSMHEDDDQAVQPLQKGSALQLFEMPKEASGSPVFTPYESPLRIFRSYRFHPDFKQQIPGGLRSLTYSHKIDPNAEFCRYELAGGICNDNTCDLLHFKDIGLPDDVILTALGSPEEFKGPRRDEFCDGLRQVLTDLRVRKIRDFQVIASEILAYRTKFLGDASKVLPLEGTSI